VPSSSCSTARNDRPSLIARATTKGEFRIEQTIIRAEGNNPLKFSANDDDALAVLDRWAGDDDFWVRRAALLALLVPLRKGGGDFDRFCRYADAMLDEKEFFILKAIGWVLRDTARKRPAMVYEWLLPRAGRASGVTLREAVKPLSAEQRAAVLAAR